MQLFFHGQHGQRGHSATMTNDDDVAKRGSHTTANTKSCSLGQQVHL